MKKITVVLDDIPVNYQLLFNDETDIEKGAHIVAQTSRGLEIVQTVSASTQAEEKEEKTFEQSVEQEEKEDFSFVRFATDKDLEADKENKLWAEKIKNEAKRLAKKYQLEMKIDAVKVTLDRGKAVINFTAENRVDFRELVKELANTFKSRIELRQIGPRDEVRVMGGFGPCGKVCCCKQFLNDFEHVSIKMAKTQNLSLNPTKISGLCGRLMCCLEYENEHYAETGRLMPRINSTVTTPNGKGTVMYNDLLKRLVSVKIGDENNSEIKVFDLKDIKQNREN